MTSNNSSLGRWALTLSAAMLVLPTTVFAQDRHGGAHPAMGGEHSAIDGQHNIEPMRAPMGYQHMQRPREIPNRPTTMDAGRYRHDFQASQPYKIGRYHEAPGFKYRRWHYGEILPPMYWGDDYLLSDYWLFGLDMPPVGYEWVRYGNDSLLINIATGEIVQSVYDIFH